MTGADREVVEGLLAAYRQGFFPMAQPTEAGRPGRIAWFSPDPRTILPLELERSGKAGGGAFHVSRSLGRVVRQGRFLMTTNRCFEAVIRACAEPRKDEPVSWIDERIIHAYCLLHRAGHAHSIEAWAAPGTAEGPAAAGELRGSPRRVNGGAKGPRGGGGGESAREALVGGLYGVHIGGAFFAESKFSRPAQGGTNASKVCLVHLVHHLRRQGFTLLDVQLSNPHLEQFGIVEIPRTEYLDRLAAATARRAEWSPFESDATRASL